MARRPFVLQPLEDRLTPSFSLTGPMSPAEFQQFTETRAAMYAVESDLPSSPTGAAPALELRDFTAVRLDHDLLRGFLADLPQEGATGPAQVFAVPRPDGSFDRFNVWEVQMMEPELAAEFPTIRTWRGQGIDDPTAVLAADLTPLGFHAQVLGPNGRWYVDPYYHLDTSVYAAYFPKDLENNHGPGCNCAACIAPLVPDLPETDPGDQPAARPNYGQTLRTYRTAVAATGEYTAFHGGTVAGGQAAIVTAVNRVSGIYETELSLRLALVGNNSSLVYTNAGTDPYSNFDGFAMLGQNQTNVTSVIGTANFDLGHVFSTGGGGVAGLGVVGDPTDKARGVTGSPTPIGDSFWVDYVAHEMGHQFGGNHTFNGVNAGSNRNGPTAYEPGSGSTIMAYAGIMGSDDLQGFSDPYFHSESLDEISDYTFSGFGVGNTQIATGNNIPTADAGPNRIIPARTPFALTGVGTDADPGDVLTYNWEQYDLGPGVGLGSPDNGSSPLFRSFIATTNPTRTFPRLPLVLSGGSSNQEILPTTNWSAMTFKLTVRDNRVTGAYNTDTVDIQVVDTGAAFAVTSPNTNVNWAAGSTQTVTWNVAGTNAAPINAGLVNILLSTDGGQTFGTVLAAGVANDGSQDVVLPNVGTMTARIKVEPVGNVFFDIGNANFRITAASSVTDVTSTLGNGTYDTGTVVPIRVTFSAPVDVTGVPRLALNSGAGVFATYASGSGTNTLTFDYVVTAGHQSPDLDYTSTGALTLNGGTINATAGGQPAALNLPAPGGAGSLGANKNIVIATTDRPAVTGVASPLANGTYGAGILIPIRVTFDRPVNVTGTPQLGLNSGAAAVATYASGSGTDTLTFNYTVGAADTSPDLDYDSGTALVLNGGTIVSPLTGDPANLALPLPGSAGSLGAANDLVIGGSSISLTAAAIAEAQEGDTVTVTVLRGGPATGAVTVDYSVASGTAGGADYVVTSPPSPLTWADGDTTPREIVLQITDDLLSEGRETFNVLLSNLTGSAGLGIAQAAGTIRQSDGRAPGLFVDTDGDKATIKLSPKTGFGTLLVYLTDDVLPVSLLETTGTDATRSAVSVTVTKARTTTTDNGTFAVGGVVGSGIKSLNLSKSAVAGDGIQLDGMLQSLKLYSLGNGADVVTTGPPIPKKKTAVSVKTAVADGSDFVLNTPVSTFSAGSFGNGRITAGAIGTLSVKGNFTGDVEAASIGALSVTGNFTGDVDLSGAGVVPGKNTLGSMKVTGFVDGSAIELAVGRVGSVSVGSFLNSHLYAGYTGNLNGVGTYDPVGRLSSFRTTAKVDGFANSSVIAGEMLNVTLASVDTTNGGTKFGVYGAFYIKSVIVKVPVRTYKAPGPVTALDDFEVGIVTP